jgi:chromosomal replication initiator protein
LELSTLWNDVRTELRHHVGDAVWAAYFRDAALREGAAGELELCTHDALAALFVEKNFVPLLEECVQGALGRPVRVRVGHGARASAPPAADAGTEQLALFADVAPAAPRTVKSASSAPPSRTALLQRAMECRLNAGQSFDRFVVGASNEFAVAAARAVAENPSLRYNPLFVYSQPGLGKTHLLHAIGLAALERNPGLRVRYVRGETFVNEFIEAVRNEDMREFRHRNRAEVDVLLLDDIQFLEAKERTQVEFFHTFNELFESGRQVVISSDRTPGDLRALDDRLRSRCAQGLVVDVQPPDLETRIAILRQRAAAQNLHVPADVLACIAENVRTNVRELHGALLRIGARAAFSRQAVTVDVAREELARVVASHPSRIDAETVVELVCAAFGVTARDLRGRKRVARIAVPRKVAMYLVRKYTGASYPELGDSFGGRDHTTVLAAVRSVEAAVTGGDALAARIEQIERKMDIR